MSNVIYELWLSGFYGQQPNEVKILQINTYIILCSEPIKCGSIIRLTHLTTKKNLHSHLFNSPLSGNQEVSAYGNDGEGDTGDHWYMDCGGDFWERDDNVQLKHVDTGA